MAISNANISLGSSFADGVRVGQMFNDQAGRPGTGVPGTQQFPGPFFNYAGNGIGTLLSPVNAYNITPWPSTVANISSPNTYAGSGPITLNAGDGFATTAMLSKSGGTYIQFDFPRVVGVVTSTTAPAAAVITIYGFDWYGFPMQQSYTLSTTYIPTAGNPYIYPNNFKQPQKAFYGVTGAYYNGASSGAVTIQLQTMNTFGLPYFVQQRENVKFCWDDQDMTNIGGWCSLSSAAATPLLNPAISSATAATNLQQFMSIMGIGGSAAQNTAPFTVAPAATAPYFVTPGSVWSAGVANTSNLTISYASAAASFDLVEWCLVGGGKYLIAGGDRTTPATATTGDVRGLIKLPDITDPFVANQTNVIWSAGGRGNTYNTANFASSVYQYPTGARSLNAQFYVYGSDAFQNQLASSKTPQGSPLTLSQWIGQPQFYTGTPT